MTLVDDDITAARRAVAAVDRQVQQLLRHFGDTVDARRLASDVGRLAPDLDLLCGPPAQPAPAPVAAAPSREKIPDSEYTHDFWMDAEDEGLGHGGPARR